MPHEAFSGVSLGWAALRALKRPQFSPASSVISPPAVSGASHSISQPRSAQQLGHAATAAASQSAAAASYSAQPATTPALLRRQGSARLNSAPAWPAFPWLPAICRGSCQFGGVSQSVAAW